MAVIIIGELINTSRAEVNDAVDARDEAKIRELAKKQADAGASYIDVNCGSRVHDEVEVMEWLVKTVQDEVDTPISFDSPNPEALAKGLEVYTGADPLVNSISGEDGRYEAIAPLVTKHNAKVVLLCMDSSGMPETSDDRMRVAEDLHSRMQAEGVEDDRMFFDPLAKPVSSVQTAGIEVLESCRRIKDAWPKSHITMGLSNISYGLPLRSRLNRVFTTMCMTVGADSFILDPTNAEHMADIITTTTLLGQDKFCKAYLKAKRKGKFDF